MNSLSILNWNIKGIGNYATRSNLRNLTVKHNPSMISIQEIKINELTDNYKDSIWPFLDRRWIQSSSDGLFGGLLISWDK